MRMTPAEHGDDFGGLTPAEAEAEIFRHLHERAPENDIDPSLDRIRAVCQMLGDPQHAFRVVHVTGTNGKTSTARMIESLIREHGLRVGLFTSPHLTSVRERIQIDGEPIAQPDFVRLWREVAPMIHAADLQSQREGGPRVSFFEALTALAFAAFADAPVDVAVVEVGLGGMWDATNVADGEVCVITPISLDHARYLGDSLDAIAREKVGIVKAGAGYGGVRGEGGDPQGPGPAVVIGEQPDSAIEPLRAGIRAADAADIWEGETLAVSQRLPGVGGQVVTLTTPAATYADIFVPLFGEHQAHNALLALAAVERLMASGAQPAALPAEVVEAGFAQVTSPGRLEVARVSPLVIVDAAHNPASADAVATALEESFEFTHLVGVVGVMEDKDAEGILGALEPLLDEVVITQAATARALPEQELSRLAENVFGPGRVHAAPVLPDAIDEAVQRAESATDIGAAVLVTGSIALVGQARALLGTDTRRKTSSRTGQEASDGL